MRSVSGKERRGQPIRKSPSFNSHNLWNKIFIKTIAGEIQPRISKVQAMSDITLLLVGIGSSDMPIDTNKLSDLASQTIPKVF